MLCVMATNTLRDVTLSIRKSIMMVETPDVADLEQLAVCLRWVDQQLEIREDFTDMHSLATTCSDDIEKAIKDVLLRLDLDISQCQGQKYVGASAMIGSTSGVATQIQKPEPRAIYTHCYGHSLSLACQDLVKRFLVIKDTPEISREIITMIITMTTGNLSEVERRNE